MNHKYKLRQRATDASRLLIDSSRTYLPIIPDPLDSRFLLHTRINLSSLAQSAIDIADTFDAARYLIAADYCRKLFRKSKQVRIL